MAKADSSFLSTTLFTGGGGGGGKCACANDRIYREEGRGKGNHCVDKNVKKIKIV